MLMAWLRHTEVLAFKAIYRTPLIEKSKTKFENSDL